ncbi:MAG: VanZ family protein [Gemmatimonadota bacterium]
MAGRAASRWAGPGAVLWTALILLLCLVPTGQTVPVGISLCLLCADRASADFIRNAMLYLPLGIAVRRSTGSLGLTITLGVLLSLGIEVTQFWIPGRFPALSDLLANGFGTAAGGFLAGALASPPEALQRNVAFLGIGALGLLAFTAPGFLFVPTVPDGELFGNWTPRIRGAEAYAGSLLSAELDGVPLPARRAEDSARVRALLEAGRPLALQFEYLPPHSPAPLFRIPTARRLEALRVSVDGEDLLVAEYLVADRLRLDRPTVRFSGAFTGLLSGDTIKLVVDRSGSGTPRASVEGGEPVVGGFPAARGWGLILSPGRLPRSVEAAGDLLWVAFILLAVSWAAPSPWRALAASGGLLATLALLPLFTPLLATPAAHYLAAGVGLASGRGLRALPATRWWGDATGPREATSRDHMVDRRSGRLV